MYLPCKRWYHIGTVYTMTGKNTDLKTCSIASKWKCGVTYGDNLEHLTASILEMWWDKNSNIIVLRWKMIHSKIEMYKRGRIIFGYWSICIINNALLTYSCIKNKAKLCRILEIYNRVLGTSWFHTFSGRSFHVVYYCELLLLPPPPRHMDAKWNWETFSNYLSFDCLLWRGNH